MSTRTDFALLPEQQERLQALRAAWEEGEEEERLLRLRQREEDTETLQAIQRLIFTAGFPQGRALDYSEMARFLALVRALAPNPNLDARLLRQPDEPATFNRDLHDLLFGKATLPFRLRQFLTRRHAGGQTALQILCAVFPEEWPLITPPEWRALELTPTQWQEALHLARTRYDLPAEIVGTETRSNQPVAVGVPDRDPVLRLLAETVVYEAVCATLSLPDFVSVYRLMRFGLSGRLPRRAAGRTRPTQPALSQVIRETPEFGYESGRQAEEFISALPSAPPPDIAAIPTEHALTDIERMVASQGFTYPPLTVRNYYLSLQSKPFILLAGVTGIGKTRLTSLFAEALTENRNAQYRLLGVRPDWHDSTPLLGYVNLLAPSPEGQGRFVTTPFLEFLRRAARPENAEKAFFLCLDEMNLARVEHYFAELLSAMETPDRELLLPNHQSVRLPANLFISGTLNLDEATHTLSRNVYDRANTLLLEDVRLRDSLPASDESEDDTTPPARHPYITTPAQRQAIFLFRRVSTVAEARAHLRQIGGPGRDLTRQIVDLLADANDILQPYGLQFAYRLRDEALRYCANSFDSDGSGLLVPETPRDVEANLRIALDFELLQKVLPRFAGSQEQMETPIQELLRWSESEGFARTAEKLGRLRNRLQRDGFATFGET